MIKYSEYVPMLLNMNEFLSKLITIVATLRHVLGCETEMLSGLSAVDKSCSFNIIWNYHLKE